MKLQLAGAVIVLSLLAAACSGPGAAERATPSPAPEPAAPAMSPTEQSEYLRDTAVSVFVGVAMRGSAQALAEASTEDVLLLMNGEHTLRGREAFRSYLAAHPLEEGGQLKCDPVRWDVSVDGLLGYTAGQAYIEGGGEVKQRYVRFLVVWTRKHLKAPWQLAAAVFNRVRSPFERPAPLMVPSAGVPPAAPRASSDTLAEVFAADRAFSQQSVEEGMDVAFPSWATEEAAFNLNGVFGRKEITREVMSLTRGRLETRWEPRLGGAAASGDLAYTVGTAASVSPPNEQGTRFYAKYITVWQRQADGSWRWAAYQGNNSPGPEAP